LIIPVRFGVPAARFSEYAIATACFCGFPAAISALTLAENALDDVLRWSGISD
jgi:hypothetical protein